MITTPRVENTKVTNAKRVSFINKDLIKWSQEEKKKKSTSSHLIFRIRRFMIRDTLWVGFLTNSASASVLIRGERFSRFSVPLNLSRMSLTTRCFDWSLGDDFLSLRLRHHVHSGEREREHHPRRELSSDVSSEPISEWGKPTVPWSQLLPKYVSTQVHKQT